MVNIIKQPNGNVWITDNISGDIRILGANSLPFNQNEIIYFGINSVGYQLSEIDAFIVNGTTLPKPTTVINALKLLSEQFFYPKTSGGGSGGKTTDASDLTSGTLPDARLSTNVLKTDSIQTETFEPSKYPTRTEVQQMINEAIQNGGLPSEPVDAPSVISNTDTIAWFKADEVGSITKNENNKITEWRDYLNRGINLSIDSGIVELQPTWSSTGVLFDGVANKLKTNVNKSQPIFVYMVCKQFGNFQDYSPFFYGSNGTGAYGFSNYGSPLVFAQAGIEQATNVPNYGDFFILRVLFNDADSKIIVNELPTKTGNLGGQGITDFILGSSSANNFEGYAAHIQYKEIILRNVVENNTDETAIYNYLKAKYAIS